MAIRRQSLGIIKKPKKIITKKKKIDMGIADDRLARRMGIKLPPKIQNDLIPLEERQPISIIITAWQTQDYIEECLDSIESQTYFKDFNNYEILVGVDGCQETLDKLLEIRHKYRNLRIFMMDSNMGTYVTSNTLLEISQFDYILRFDSDDIMLPEMINITMKTFENKKFLYIPYVSFNTINNNRILNTYRQIGGVFIFSRELLKFLGGFEPWVCSADGDFVARAKQITKIYDVNMPLFHRRIHDKNLTILPETSINSEMRKKLHEISLNKLKNNEIFVQIKINAYKEIKNMNKLITLNDFFDEIYLINLDKRPDKLQDSLFELQKIGARAKRVSAVDGSLTFKPGMNLNAGNYGLLQTHLKIYDDAIKNGYKKILILEDDVMFIDEFNEKFSSKINQLPDDWDMFYIGGNNIFSKGKYQLITGDKNFKITKENYKTLNHELVKTTWTQCAHAIGINSKFFNIILEFIKENPTLPNDLHHPLLQQKGYNAYIFMPSLALQRPSVSDIERRFVNYNIDPQWGF